jgi:hypothetical protein
MIGVIINVDDGYMSKISERYRLPFIEILLSSIFVIKPPETLRRYCKGRVTVTSRTFAMYGNFFGSGKAKGRTVKNTPLMLDYRLEHRSSSLGQQFW